MNRYLTLGPRILAFLIDAIVFAPLVLVVFVIDDLGIPEWTFFILAPIFSFAGVAYNVLLHWRFGQTLGKMAMRVRVVNLAEEPITFGQACLRDIAYIISKTLEVGSTLYLMIAGFSWISDTVVYTEQYLAIPLFSWFVIDAIVCVKSKKNRALHDFIAGTVVTGLNMPGADETEKNLNPPAPDAYDGLRANAVYAP